METLLAPPWRDHPDGRVAADILRRCVHCGFCNATCPTYLLLGDEREGPRGRLYLMKQMLEGQPVGTETRAHLDRCLTCRNCETTCPSGVEYSQLLDIARAWLEPRRPAAERLARQALRRGLTTPGLWRPALRAGRLLGDWLPAPLRPPPVHPAPARPTTAHARTMLLLEGCVQPDLAPATNAIAARLLDRLGIQAIPAFGCCGALDQHLGAREAARAALRRNIDAWWPAIAAGAEAIVSTASGCGSQVKDYGRLLADDPAYAEKAARVAALARDIAQVLAAEPIETLAPKQPPRVAYHPPCSLRHGQKLPGLVEGILARLGIETLPFAEDHLCCGAAGSYSLIQPELSQRLRQRKLAQLRAAGAELVVTANIGCQTHLAGEDGLPTRHWIELLELEGA